MREACMSCGLYKTCVSPCFNYFGKGEKKILVVDGLVSKTDDETGSFGESMNYQFLKGTIDSLGFSLENDCWFTTAINCRMLPGKKPTRAELMYCRERLVRLIERLQPKKILLVGEYPFKSLLGPRLVGRIKGTPWNSFSGYIIPDQELKCYVAPIGGCDYFYEERTQSWTGITQMRYQWEPATYQIWTNHIKALFEHTDAFYTTNYSSDCITTRNEQVAIGWLESALTWDAVSFDYETTGVKPHMGDHFIGCASISNGIHSFAFPFFQSEAFLSAWRNLMRSDVKKISHNLQFENIWTYVHGGGEWPRSWYWDTMLGAHCEHNLNPTGLKFQTYVQFGDIGYDDAVDMYLKSSTKDVELYGDNAVNRLQEVLDDPELFQKLLTYNALDSLYTYRLYQKQKTTLSEDQQAGLAFLVESAVTLSQLHQNGICIDLDVLQKNLTTLTAEMESHTNTIMSLPDVARWDRETPFNFNSTEQLGHLLFDVLKLKPEKYTDAGRPTVDKEVLPKYDIPLIKSLISYREALKRVGYLKDYLRETVDGKVHPFFQLHRVDSFRSSCGEPNVQNIPKRDMVAKHMIREVLRPSKGNRIIEWDNASLEVRINACYSGDPNLMAYINDPTKDFHRDSTKECFLLSDSEMKKEHRSVVKGMFVFAEFYGSYYKQVAKDLWEYAGTNELRAHLASKGVKTYTQFEELIKEAERILWQERFPVHAQWRKDQFAFYEKHGYINTFTGFKLQGPMGRNNTFNGCVQGSGYHVLQWTLNQVQRRAMSRCERSFLVGEIHDSIVGDIHPSEEAWFDNWIWLYGTERVREHWPWITVPLAIEKERSEIDGTWADMTGCGLLNGEYYV